jgi:anti-sigma factor RsiW
MTDSQPDDRTLLLQAALDGELDAAGMMDVEAKLDADLALEAEYARLVALRDAIRTRLPRERAPDALRARVIAIARAPTQISPTAPLLAARRARSLPCRVGDARGRAGRRGLWPLCFTRRRR